jgi:hypothetical protein
MPISDCYLFKNSFEYFTIEHINDVPAQTRGLYVLFNSIAGKKYEVVYIGMARGDKTGVKGRLLKHRRNKAKMWTHFSVFEVWDNITKEQVEELEGFFRHVYRYDPTTLALGKQRSYRPLRRIRRKSAAEWK